ncbi:MAG: hypothetical protein U1E90_00735 [Burkholderiaceae bacterium]
MASSQHALQVSRPAWLRVIHLLAGAAPAVGSAWREARSRAAARRARGTERAALGHLSPHLLCDIGASAELLAESRQRELHHALRLDAHRL